MTVAVLVSLVTTNIYDRYQALPRQPMCILPRSGKTDFSLTLPRQFHYQYHLNPPARYASIISSLLYNKLNLWIPCQYLPCSFPPLDLPDHSCLYSLKVQSFAFLVIFELAWYYQDSPLRLGHLKKIFSGLKTGKRPD